MRTFALFIALGLAGCDTDVFLGKACTDIGCSDGLSLSFNTVDGHWPDGDYHLELDFAGDQHRCSFRLPDALPKERGATGQAVCEANMSGYFSAKTMCMETRSKDSVSQSCTPLDGQWTLDLHRDGTPKTVSVRVTRDEREVASVSRTIDYQENRPNGPDCEPLCRQARIDLLVE